MTRRQVALPHFVALALFALLAAGCIGAFNPTWRAQDVISPSKFAGTWNLVKLDGEAVKRRAVKPWTFRVDQEASIEGTKRKPIRATVHDEEGRAGDLSIVFFKVAGQVYAETSPEGTHINDDVRVHLVPRRLLHRVVFRGDQLHVHEIDREWFKNSGAARLQSLQIGGSHTTMATAEDWRKELMESAKEMFAKDPYLVLKRAKKAPAGAKKSPQATPPKR